MLEELLPLAEAVNDVTSRAITTINDGLFMDAFLEMKLLGYLGCARPVKFVRPNV